MSKNLREKDSKKLREKQRKRLAEQAKKAQQKQAQRRSNLITLGVAVVVLVGIGLLVFGDRSNSGSADVAKGVAAAAAGCSEIEAAPDEGHDHVDDGTTVDYGTNPPTSGNHYGTPADPAFYDDALAPEQLVHNLEHGQIVFWYSPDAPQDVKDSLEALVNDANSQAAADQAPGPLLASPYEEVPGDFTFSMSTWTRSQSCREYSLEAINDFRSRFQGEGREGVGVPTFSD